MHFDIEFYGHENIRSLHQKTIEITKEAHLTPNGDCIIGVRAASACNDLPIDLKNKLRDPDSKVTVSIKVKGKSFVINGKGGENLSLSHPSDIVIRKSRFMCPRTLAIGCDGASDSIPRDIVDLLRDPKIKGIFSIDVS